jgi:hypothetical protein
MDTSRLNHFSKQIYDQLRVYIPELIGQAEEKPESNGNFYVRISSPIKEESVWLGIYTEADPYEGQEPPTGEVTWEYDYFHSHSFGRNSQEAFEWLKEDLEKLFNGSRFIGSTIVEGKCSGSRELSRSKLDDYLAGKLDFSAEIDQLMKMKISDSQKERWKKNYLNATQTNRVVGWNHIYLK